MQPIPTPQLLDPNRILDNDRNDVTADHKARADLFANALQESCGYAEQLWHTLNALRTYLMDSLPPEHDSLAANGASPTGPDDEQGWQDWIDAYAAVTSVLCGPHGDSGYGASEAQQAAQARRTVDVPGDQPDGPQAPVPAAGPVTSEPHGSQPGGGQPSGQHRDRPDRDDRRQASEAPALPRPVRLLAAGVIGVLALRGLRRSPGAGHPIDHQNQRISQT